MSQEQQLVTANESEKQTHKQQLQQMHKPKQQHYLLQASGADYTSQRMNAIGMTRKCFLSVYWSLYKI